MKLKILITPIAIVLMIVLVIWGIVPAYSAYKQQVDILKADQEKLNDVQGKQRSVGSLFDELSSNSDKQSTLRSYIPVAMQEEDMFNTINGLASDEGVLVYALSVSKESAKDGVSADRGMNSAATSARQASVDKLTMKIGVSGGYDKIKNFLGKLSRLERSNEIISLDISANADEATSGASNNLNADLTVSFPYMKKADSIPSFSNTIFTTGKFDMAVISEIENRDTSLSNVSVGSTGKSNPFLP